VRPLRILTKLSHNVSPSSLKDHPKALAAFWTPDGDYERVLNGRPAIEKDSADLEWLRQTVAARGLIPDGTLVLAVALLAGLRNAKVRMESSCLEILLRIRFAGLL
jgi:hypothetical protein